MGTVGAVQPKLPLYNIQKINIYWPEKPVRKAIVNQLSILDDKIETNYQTNQALEAIAQAIFKSWFVDFDPVKAKIAVLESGGSTADAELTAMSIISSKSLAELAEFKQSNIEEFKKLAQTAALFPSAMQESELGTIPEGWALINLESIIQLAYGKSLKKEVRIAGQFPVYGSGGINGTHNQALVKGPGIIIGRKGTVGSIYWEKDDFFPIDTVFYVKTKPNISLEFSYYLLQTLGLNNMNTDAAVPGLNRSNVYRLELPKFPEELMNDFSVIAKSLISSISDNQIQKNILENIRDTLLPKLLSGEISLSALKKETTEINA
jgi:type I restriction enzyme S subunit